MTWRKKFNIDNKGTDDLRPGQRLIVYAKMENDQLSDEALELWLWNLTPDEFEYIMNWSLE
jgi:hypothetical protein